MTFAVRLLFQYRLINFITKSRLASTTSGLITVEDGDVCTVMLLTNVDLGAFFHDCDARYALHCSLVCHIMSLLSAGSLNILRRASGYPPHLT